MIDKTVRTIAEALEGIRNGATVLVGGFAMVGEPAALLDGLAEQGARDLTIAAIAAGRGNEGIARLVGLGRVRKLIVSWTRSPGEPSPFADFYRAGKIELDLTPQGTLAERIRAAGAGVPAFFTPTSAGTALAAGKEHREINGRTHVLEHAIYADVALVQAWQADRWGNLTYRRAGRNLNAVMAMAAKGTIAQSMHMVELGALDPDHIATPGIFVHRVLHVPDGTPPLT